MSQQYQLQQQPPLSQQYQLQQQQPLSQHSQPQQQQQQQRFAPTQPGPGFSAALGMGSGAPMAASGDAPYWDDALPDHEDFSIVKIDQEYVDPVTVRTRGLSEPSLSGVSVKVLAEMCKARRFELPNGKQSRIPVRNKPKDELVALLLGHTPPVAKGKPSKKKGGAQKQRRAALSQRPARGNNYATAARVDADDPDWEPVEWQLGCRASPHAQPS